MQTPAEEAVTAPETSSAADSSDALIVEAEEIRPREEMTVLIAGFGLALLIGGFFLLYIVIAIAHIGALGGS